MKLFDEIKKLNFPTKQYVVVGSGPLVARGIRETQDIDVVVHPDLFEKCKNEGWRQIPWTYEKMGQIYLRRENVELYLDVNCKDFNPTFEQLRSSADIINDIPFASLSDTVSFKKAYNKPKHLKDVELVRKFLISEAQRRYGNS